MKKRKIIFRGLKINKSGWIHGMPIYDFTHIFSEEQVDSPDNYEVIPATIGQFTGLIDKNGVMIYEGDIIRNKQGDTSFIVYSDFAGRFGINSYYGGGVSFFYQENEVIGNIHQNKNLL